CAAQGEVGGEGLPAHRVRLGHAAAPGGGPRGSAYGARGPACRRTGGRGPDAGERHRGCGGGRRAAAPTAEEEVAPPPSGQGHAESVTGDRILLTLCPARGGRVSNTGVMRAVRYHEYGGPDVLRLEDVPVPEAGPGQVRIAVGASAVNRMDIKLRSGAMASSPLAHPRVPGLDAGGVVDQVGEGVTDVQVGVRVLGAGSATLAELAVLDHFTPVPEGLSLVQAAALPTVAETAGRVLSLLPGDAGAVL